VKGINLIIGQLKDRTKFKQLNGFVNKLYKLGKLADNINPSGLFSGNTIFNRSVNFHFYECNELIFSDSLTPNQELVAPELEAEHMTSQLSQTNSLAERKRIHLLPDSGSD